MLLECTYFINGTITAPSKNVDDYRPFEPTFKTTFNSCVYLRSLPTFKRKFEMAQNTKDQNPLTILTKLTSNNKEEINKKTQTVEPLLSTTLNYHNSKNLLGH